jgi:hypothetical protein
MNQRIRELAELAKGFVDLNQHIGGTNGCMVYTYNGLEKFAELIVRECIEVIDMTHGSKKLMRPDPYQKIIWAIEEHFGVEE